MNQQTRISPEKALESIDNACRKYMGTRDDHIVLSGSVNVLKQIVQEWRALQAEKEERERVARLTPIEAEARDESDDDARLPDEDAGTNEESTSDASGEVSNKG